MSRATELVDHVPAPTQGRLFFAYLSFGEAKESKTRLKRGKHKLRKGTKCNKLTLTPQSQNKNRP
jgi:hypothetical protein